MKKFDTMNRQGGIMMLGRVMRRGTCALAYTVLSFTVFILGGSGMGSASFLPFAILSSWAGLLSRWISSPVEGLIKHYGMDEIGTMPIIMAVILFILIFIYLLALLQIIAKVTRIQRVAGLIAPLLFHFLGSFLILTPHPNLDLWMLGVYREVLFYAVCAVSFALVLGYIVICWRISVREKE